MKLREPAFRALPLNSIRPQGWLMDQLRLQAGSLSGHLDTFWPDIKDSAWIGGEAEGWERMPYWLDGVIPLAWLTGDEELQARIRRYLDYILTHQSEDGWLGPKPEHKPEAADVWSQALALKMLVVYEDATGDARVMDAVLRNLRMMERRVDQNLLANWGRTRWFEFLITVWWAYERQSEPWLLDLAVKLKAQSFGWSEFFSHWPITSATPKHWWNQPGHVVNNAMAVKSGALWWRFSGKEEDRMAPAQMLKLLDLYHGQASGIFSGDECLSGTSPRQGTELCAVAELMYSLEWLAAIEGGVAWADRLEYVAFNALPATFSPDMWSHQYVQQVNQIACTVRENPLWNTNGPDANIFGLEPHFGCCTSNLSQAWPKFAAHLWMASGDGGLAAVAYAPVEIRVTLHGVPVSVTVETDYPFRDHIAVTVRAEGAVNFPLHLRIPGWARQAAVTVAGESQAPVAGEFLCIDREWSGETRIEIDLPASPEWIPRPAGTRALRRGSLLFALPVPEHWTQIHEDLPHREMPHADWEIRPTGPWNFALNPATPVSRAESDMRFPVFSPENAPVSLTVEGHSLPQWKEENGSTEEISADLLTEVGPAESLRLIPFGCTNLRIAEFPVVERT